MFKGNKKLQTDEMLIDHAIYGNWLKALALYHGLKYTFSNSMIYTYSKARKKQELADRWGITVHYLTVLVRQLKKNGLAEKTNSGRDLLLRSIYKIKPRFNDGKNVKHRCTLHLDDQDTLETIKIKLYAKMLEKAARQMVWENPAERNRDSAHGSERGEPREPVLSYQRMGEIFGCSKTQAWNIVQRMKKLGIIKTENKKQKLRQFSGYLENHRDLIGYFFVFSGWLWVHYGTALNLLQYPV